MSKSRLEWKVGLFVFIGLVLLGGLLLEFSKGLTLFRKTYDIHLKAENAGVLKVNAQVLMSGVQVGRVSNIQLAPSGKFVIMTLRIYGEYRIYKDARFAIEQSGFLGDEYVAIIPTKNQGELFQDQNEAQAEPPFNLQEVARSATGVVQRIDETAKTLNDSLMDVRRLLLNPETLTNLADAAGNLRAASERAVATVDRFNRLLATNSPALARTATNLESFSGQMNQFAADLSTVIASNSPAIDTAVKNIESSTAVLKTLMDDVQAGHGPAGTVLKNEQFAANLSQIVYNLSVTTSNLNRRGLWGILWAHKPPPQTKPAETAPLASPKGRSEPP